MFLLCQDNVLAWFTSLSAMNLEHQVWDTNFPIHVTLDLKGCIALQLRIWVFLPPVLQNSGLCIRKAGSEHLARYYFTPQPPWDLMADAFPLYFTTCLQIICITAQVAIAVLSHQLGRWTCIHIHIPWPRWLVLTLTDYLSVLPQVCDALLYESLVTGWVNSHFKSCAKAISGY